MDGVAIVIINIAVESAWRFKYLDTRVQEECNQMKIVAASEALRSMYTVHPVGAYHQTFEVIWYINSGDAMFELSFFMLWTSKHSATALETTAQDFLDW